MSGRANFEISGPELTGMDLNLVGIVRRIILPGGLSDLRFEGYNQGSITVSLYNKGSSEAQYLDSFQAKEVIRLAYAVEDDRIIEVLLSLGEIDENNVKFLRPKIKTALRRLIRDMSKTFLPIPHPFIRSK